MEISRDILDGTTISLFDGLTVRIPRFTGNVQDAQNVMDGLLALIARLDNRLAAIEGRAAPPESGERRYQQWRR